MTTQELRTKKTELLDEVNALTTMKTLEIFKNQIDDLNNQSGYKIATEQQIEEWAKQYVIETKDDDGCKIEFLVEKSTGNPVCAVITEEGVSEKLDEANMKFAYADFDAF